MIPTRNLEEQVPYILRDVEEIKALMRAGQDAFDREAESDTEKGIWRAMEQALGDAFAETASEWGLSRWEEMLGIETLRQGELSREDWITARRMAILARIRGNAPYTFVSLVNRLLAAILERSKYRVHASVYDTDLPRYSIYIGLELGHEASFAAVKAMLERVVPCNLRIFITMLFNRHKDYRDYKEEGVRACTHTRMHNHTHGDLRNRKWENDF